MASVIRGTDDTIQIEDVLNSNSISILINVFFFQFNIFENLKFQTKRSTANTTEITMIEHQIFHIYDFLRPSSF